MSYINQLVILEIGKYNNISSKQFNKKQIKLGLKVEKEHTDDPKVAIKIAKDHLAEIPDYYSRLNKLEKSASKH